MSHMSESDRQANAAPCGIADKQDAKPEKRLLLFSDLADLSLEEMAENIDKLYVTKVLLGELPAPGAPWPDD